MRCGCHLHSSLSAQPSVPAEKPTKQDWSAWCKDVGNVKNDQDWGAWSHVAQPSVPAEKPVEQDTTVGQILGVTGG